MVICILVGDTASTMHACLLAHSLPSFLCGTPTSASLAILSASPPVGGNLFGQTDRRTQRGGEREQLRIAGHPVHNLMAVLTPPPSTRLELATFPQQSRTSNKLVSLDSSRFYKMIPLNGRWSLFTSEGRRPINIPLRWLLESI